jgi:excinuclease ABC subunit A
MAGRIERAAVNRVGSINGRSIAEVLQMTVDQADAFFMEEDAIARPLHLLQQISLGYLMLGQPATELSG